VSRFQWGEKNRKKRRGRLNPRESQNKGGDQLLRLRLRGLVEGGPAGLSGKLGCLQGGNNNTGGRGEDRRDELGLPLSCPIQGERGAEKVNKVQESKKTP